MDITVNFKESSTDEDQDASHILEIVKDNKYNVNIPSNAKLDCKEMVNRMRHNTLLELENIVSYKICIKKYIEELAKNPSDLNNFFEQI